MTRVYTARAMTGRDAREVLAESRAANQALRTYGLTPLDPALDEGVQPGDGVLAAPEEKLREFWRRDKALIRRAHVVLDLTGNRKSEGVAAELGYARFFLWKPTVRVWPGLGPSIARFEGDVVVENVFQAAAVIKEKWGTPWKRVKWRAQMYLRCRVKALYYEAKEFANAVS